MIVGASVGLGIAAVFATANPALPPSSSPSTSAEPSGPVAQASPLPTGGPGYLASAVDLVRRATLAGDGIEPYAAALADLMADAERDVGRVPQPIQPLHIVDDGGPFADDGVAAYGLALAYRITGEVRYGESAATIIRAWVRDVTEVADICASSGSCHTSLIVSRMGATYVFAADLLDGTSVWSQADRSGLAGWLEHVILPAASERTNNWGDAGTLLRVALTDYVGDETGFAQAIDHWRDLMDLVQPDGSIPEEVRRGTDGLLYMQEALQYKVAVAEIAGRRGIDLWGYVGREGGTLLASLDLVARYWSNPGDWPWDPAVTVPRPGPVWELAYAHWQVSAWVPILTERRPFGDAGHSALRWTTLTSGIPTTVAGPGPTPTPAPTATPPPPVPDLGVPSMRLAAIPSDGRAEIRLTWPLADPAAADVVTTRIEFAVADGAFSGISGSSRPGREVVVRVPLDRDIRFRARVIDAAGSPGEWVDGPAVVVRIHDDRAPVFAYSGAWIEAGFRTYVEGNAAASSASGARATLTVDAYAALVIGPVGATRGQVDIAIDGAPSDRVDLYAPRFDPSTIVVAADWPDATTHTIRFTVLGAPASRPTVSVDAVVVIEPVGR